MMGIPKSRLDQILESKSRGRLSERLGKVIRRRNLLRAYNTQGLPDFEVLRVVPSIYQSLVDLTGKTHAERSKYLHSHDERAKKELFVVDGRICLENIWAPSEMSAVDAKYIFSLSPDGRLFGHQEPTGICSRNDSFTHACFLAGAPCKSAGEMYIRKGRLAYLNNSSGHYMPPPKSLAYVVDWLKSRGVSTGKVVCLHADAPNTICDLMAFSPNGIPTLQDNGALEHEFHLEQVKRDAIKNQVAKLADEIEEIVWNDGDVEQKCRELYSLIEIEMCALHPMSYVVLGVLGLAIGKKIDYVRWQMGMK